MAYNVSQKLHDNLRAIRTALDYQNGRPLTAEDVASLKKYAGFWRHQGRFISLRITGRLAG